MKARPSSRGKYKSHMEPTEEELDRLIAERYPTMPGNEEVTFHPHAEQHREKTVVVTRSTRVMRKGFP